MTHPVMEIPRFLEDLPVYAGFPIPFTTFVHEDGKPDFRVTDMAKWDRCVTERLCGICGRKLGVYSYFIGGPSTREQRLFFDPPMHKECAEFAAKICPFLNGRKTEYRPITQAAPPGIEVTEMEMVSDVRPEKMFLMKSKTWRLVMVQGKLLILSGEFSRVTEF